MYGSCFSSSALGQVCLPMTLSSSSCTLRARVRVLVGSHCNGLIKSTEFENTPVVKAMRTQVPQSTVEMSLTREFHKLQTNLHSFDDEGILCRIDPCTKHNTKHVASRSPSVNSRTDM